MDLAKIGFEIDTSNVKSAVEELRSLRDAALGVTKAFKSAKDAGETSTERAERNTKSMSSHVKAYEKAVDSAVKSEEKNADSIEKTIELLRLRRNEIAQGAKSSEASTIAMLRYKDATEEQVAEVKKLFAEIQRIGGKNPFDSVIGEMRRLKDETNEYKNIIEASGKSVGLTAKELKEIAQIQEKINIIGRETGSTQDEINRKVKEATEEYKQQVQEKNRLKSQVEAIEKAEAQAEARLRNQVALSQKIAENRRQAELINQGFSSSTARTITNLESQGYNISEIRQFIAAEKDLAKAKESTSNSQKAATAAVNQFADAHVLAFRKAEASAESYANKSLEAVKKQLQQVKAEAALAAQGLSRTTATGVVRLQGRGASQSEIDEFIKTRKEIEAITAASKKGNTAVLGLATVIRQIAPAAGALGIVSLITQIGVAAIQTADQLSQLKSRIGLATQGTADFNVEFDNLLRIANESRTSIQDVGTLYSRLIPVVDKLGGSTLEAAAITESFSKLLLVGGSNTREASAAIVQFSQALGKGKLDGDEFRSIAEATPEVLRLLEESLGKTRGELFKMSSDGKLTADILGNVLINALESLDAKLLGVPLTVGQSLQLIRNNLTETLKIFEEGTGSVGELAGIFQGIATSVFDFNQGLKSGAYDEAIRNFVLMNQILANATLGLVAVRTAMSVFAASTGQASAALTVFNFVLGANPIVRVVSVVAALSAAIFGLRNETFDLNGQLVSLSSLFEATFGGLLTVVESALNQVKSEFSTLFSFLNAANETYKSVVKSVVNTIIGSIAGAASYISTFFTGFVDAAKAAFSDVSGLTSAFFNDLFSGDFEFTSFKTKLSGSFSEGFKLASQSAKAFSESFNKDYVGEFSNSLGNLTSETYNNIVAKAASIEVDKAYNALMEQVITQNEREAKALEESEKRRKNLKALKTGEIEQSKAEAEEKAKLEKAVQKQISSLEKEISVTKQIMGLIGDERKLLQDKVKNIELLNSLGLSENSIQGQKILNLITELDLLKKQDQALQDIAEEKQRVLKEAKSETKSIEENNKKLQEEIDLFGKSAKEIAEYRIQMKQAQADKARFEGNEDLAKELDKQVALLKEGGLKEVELENKRIAKQLEDDIIEAFEKAFLEGADLGKALKKSLQAQFSKLVLRPVIEAVISGGDIGAAISKGFGSLGGFSSAISTLSTGAVGGELGLALRSGLKSGLTDIAGALTSTGADFATSAYAFTQTGQSIVALQGTLSKIAPYAGSIAQALQGDLKGAAFSAAGTYIGGAVGGPLGAAIGSFVGNLVGGLFGGAKAPAVNLSNATTSTDRSGLTKILEGGGARGQDQAVNALQAVSTAYRDTVKALGGQAQALEAYLQFNSGKNSANPLYYLITKNEQGQEVYRSGEVALGNEEQFNRNFSESTLRSTFGLLKTTKGFASNIKSVIDSVDVASSSFEQLQSTMQDLQILGIVNTEFKKLGPVLGSLANQSLETIKTFFALAGGFEGLQQRQTAFISAIYTEEEQLALATDNLNKSLTNLGVAVPKTTSEYRKLVESQNLTTIEGQALYLALLDLAPAFAQITKANEEAAEALNSRVLEERNKLEEELFELTATSSQMLAKQREALDESNRSLFDQIQAIKAKKEAEEKAIEDVTKAYETQKASVQGVKDKFKGFADTLASYKNQLLASNNILTGEQQYALDRANFNQTVQNLSSTDASIREKAFADFTQVADKFLGTSKEFSASYVQYLQDFAAVAAATSQAEADALTQVSIAEEQLIALDQMVAGIVKVDNSILTLAQALNNFYALGLLPQPTPVGAATPAMIVQNTTEGQTLQPTLTMPVVNTQTVTRSELENQLIILNGKIDQMITENRVASQAVVVPLNKTAKILERADDGDSINVRIVT